MRVPSGVQAGVDTSWSKVRRFHVPAIEAVVPETRGRRALDQHGERPPVGRELCALVGPLLAHGERRARRGDRARPARARPAARPRARRPASPMPRRPSARVAPATDPCARRPAPARRVRSARAVARSKGAATSRPRVAVEQLAVEIARVDAAAQQRAASAGVEAHQLDRRVLLVAAAAGSTPKSTARPPGRMIGQR